MANVGARPLAAEARGTRARHDRGRTPAQLFSIVVGPVLVLIGILGFVADSTFDVGSNDSSGGPLQGDGFLGFEVTGWHNLVHIASGLLLVVFAKRRSTAKAATLGFGAVYALVTVIGLIDGNDVLGFIPVNAADNVLHALLSLGSLVAGFVSRGDDRAADVTGRDGHQVVRAHGSEARRRETAGR
jgi:Domain of unknown function (DUF4383)